MAQSLKKPNNLDRLQAKIEYVFDDQSLLLKALSHRSVGKINNERLEFLGDSLLNFFIGEALYEKFEEAKEGDLSRLRANLVKGDTLAEIAKELVLGDYLLLGGGELKSGGYRRESILADTVEALIGAVYIESGMARCKSFTLNLYQQRLDAIDLQDIQKDPKTRLQEFLQERKKHLPKYRVIEEAGDMHAREYTIECRVDYLNLSFQASATSKRVAEKKAAEKALNYIDEATRDGRL